MGTAPTFDTCIVSTCNTALDGPAYFDGIGLCCLIVTHATINRRLKLNAFITASNVAIFGANYGVLNDADVGQLVNFEIEF